MYNLPPPVDALDWPLGLVRDVCVEVGLGRSDSSSGRWTDDQLSDQLYGATTRHWWTQPASANSKVLERFMNLVTDGEQHEALWRFVIENSADRKGSVFETRDRIFGLRRFSKKTREDKFFPTLSNMAPLTGEILASYKKSKVSPDVIFTIRRALYKIGNLGLIGVFGVVLAIGLIAGIQISKLGLPSSSDEYGTLFSNIQFCSDTEFEYLPSNRCLSNTINFEEGVEKINLSFKSTKVILPGTPFTLKWFRNGVLQLERERPWSLAFAFGLRSASTHVQMRKFDSLPKEWSDPGTYNVQFYLSDRLVDEAVFHIKLDSDIGEG